MQAEDIGWLAGIIDGEGCLSVRTHKCGIGYSVYLHVANCSVVLLGKVVRVLREMGAESVSAVRTMSPRNLKPHHSPKYQVTLTKRDELMVVLKIVMPHLTEKRAFCEAVVEFYDKKRWNSRWTDNEIQMMQSIRDSYMFRRTA